MSEPDAEQERAVAPASSRSCKRPGTMGVVVLLLGLALLAGTTAVMQVSRSPGNRPPSSRVDPQVRQAVVSLGEQMARGMPEEVQAIVQAMSAGLMAMDRERLLQTLIGMSVELSEQGGTEAARREAWMPVLYLAEQIDDHRMAQALLAAVGRERKRSTRCAAQVLMTLGNLRDPTVAASLRQMAGSDDDPMSIRIAAAYGACRLSGERGSSTPEYLEYLGFILYQAESPLGDDSRPIILQALGGLGDQRAAPTLRRLHSRVESPYREQIEHMLAALGAPVPGATGPGGPSVPSTPNGGRP